MNNYSTWRKSSFSEPENECVEVTWRKSSYSAPENACVEISAGAIRDSKNPHGTQVDVSDLAAFLNAIKR